jgi:ferric-dicitrate binding protein FerR (iron transport regulator)
MLVAHAPVGQVITVTLPDSSVVYLNSGSTLTYPEKFAADKREVSLEGQGWFKVYASRTYPFYVNTSRGMTLYVYGTEFDLAAYPHEKDVEIYLASGNLNMMLPVKNVECAVKPNQKLTYDTVEESIAVLDIPGGMGYDWKEGNLCFRHSTMSEILTSLSRRFDVVIDAVNASADTNEYHASFTSSETLEDILTQLSGLSELTWHNVGTDADGRKHITVKY